MRETLLQSQILAILNHPTSPCRLWRNNVGSVPGTWIKYGLGVGSADLVGLVLGTGQFIGVEIKTPKGRLSAEQIAWGNTITKFGGQWHCLRSTEQAVQLVESLRKHGQ